MVHEDPLASSGAQQIDLSFRVLLPGAHPRVPDISHAGNGTGCVSAQAGFGRGFGASRQARASSNSHHAAWRAGNGRLWSGLGLGACCRGSSSVGSLPSNIVRAFWRVARGSAVRAGRSGVGSSEVLGGGCVGVGMEGKSHLELRWGAGCCGVRTWSGSCCSSAREAGAAPRPSRRWAYFALPSRHGRGLGS